MNINIMSQLLFSFLPNVDQVLQYHENSPFAGLFSLFQELVENY